MFLLVFPNYLIGGSVQCSLIAYCAQCNCVLCDLCAKKQPSAQFLQSCTNCRGFTIRYTSRGLELLWLLFCHFSGMGRTRKHSWNKFGLIRYIPVPWIDLDHTQGPEFKFQGNPETIKGFQKFRSIMIFMSYMYKTYNRYSIHCRSKT